jgi:cytochrome c-type biogenesis protein CcmH
VRLAALLVAALALAAPAAAGSKPNAAEIETELVCPVCHETLDQSTAPIAQEMKATIRKRIAQGWTKKQIIDEMVANFGPQVLSTPSKHGFDTLAWVLPIGGALLGVAALAYGARRWTRAPAAEPGQELARFDG